jgi:hypothetical protein
MPSRATTLVTTIALAALAAPAAGCHAHHGCGHGHRRPGALDAVAFVAGVGWALAETAARREASRVAVAQQPEVPPAPLDPPLRPMRYGWVIHQRQLLQARPGVTVVVSSPHGVNLRLVTSNGQLHIPALEEGRYTAAIDDPRFTGSSDFDVGPGDHPPLYIHARAASPPAP